MKLKIYSLFLSLCFQSLNGSDDVQTRLTAYDELILKVVSLRITQSACLQRNSSNTIELRYPATLSPKISPDTILLSKHADKDYCLVTRSLNNAAQVEVCINLTKAHIPPEIKQSISQNKSKGRKWWHLFKLWEQDEKLNLNPGGFFKFVVDGQDSLWCSARIPAEILKAQSCINIFDSNQKGSPSSSNRSSASVSIKKSTFDSEENVTKA